LAAIPGHAPPFGRKSMPRAAGLLQTISSVQLWSSKIDKLALNQIGHGFELYAWGYDYDPKFLGIMAGVLKMNQIERDGYAFV